ncbi:hypothetical protein HZH66_005223 [Vespula vulgaris]|uniref:Protein sprouty n=1 Tax=Vespula vulgaris TaxID=7454 RepID=A0A834KBZ4_VESVU|nr:hypothetical protein HZH66_005223 [Vespula vulgaris]
MFACLILGGDEARVARARGSGRGVLPSTILANGTPPSRVPPPRAGWAATLSSSSASLASGGGEESVLPSVLRGGNGVRQQHQQLQLQLQLQQQQQQQQRQNYQHQLEDRRENEEELEATKKEECRPRHQRHQQGDCFELRGRQMSQKNAIPGLSRAAVVNGVVDGEHVRVHDHNRPFPPPRTSPSNTGTTNTGTTTTATTTAAAAATTTTTTTASPTSTTTTALRIPMTAPLAPLSSLSSSFRSRPTSNVRTPPAQSFESSPPPATLQTAVSPRNLLTPTSMDVPTPPRSPLGEVSLATPRPDGERIINEYVETPFKQQSNVVERRLDGIVLVDTIDGKRSGNDCPKKERARSRGKHATDSGIPSLHRAVVNNTSGSRRRGLVDASNNHPSGIILSGTASTINTAPATVRILREGGDRRAVTKQPVSFTKEPANALGSRTYEPGLSIICEYCGRCRCESCREPPPLPSRWLCNDSCFCSAETVLDYASCLCCVKGLFYHCVDGNGGGGGPGSGATGPSSMDVDNGESCADQPCSCSGNRTLSRWACLSALTLAMPCLLCYWPLKGCVAVCETCYARHASQGCRCEPGVLTGSNTSSRHHAIANDIGYSRDPEKRLLDPVTPEL